jgi:hypothetical protein
MRLCVEMALRTRREKFFNFFCPRACIKNRLPQSSWPARNKNPQAACPSLPIVIRRFNLPPAAITSQLQVLPIHR